MRLPNLIYLYFVQTFCDDIVLLFIVAYDFITIHMPSFDILFYLFKLY